MFVRGLASFISHKSMVTKKIIFIYTSKPLVVAKEMAQHLRALSTLAVVQGSVSSMDIFPYNHL